MEVMNFMKKSVGYDMSIIVTQRCNAKCSMCNLWANPTKTEEEIDLKTIEKLPYCELAKISGGEPFIRSDIQEIIALLKQKAKRVMITTNGYYQDKIVAAGRAFPDLAIRVSIDGERETHNRIRGIDIYDTAWQTLRLLKENGSKDVGISFTLQDSNYADLLPVYRRARELDVDFGCTIINNSFYFHKDDNEVKNVSPMEEQLRFLIREQLKSPRIKDWARAFFNDYTIRYLHGEKLPIQCNAGISSFFLDVNGNVLPCNMTPTPWVMGNLREQTWEEILASDAAKKVQLLCKNCKTPCWVTCNVQTAIKKEIWVPVVWLLKNKFTGGK